MFFIFIFAIAAIVMLLWNALIPELFHGPVLSYWQAFGLLLLSRLMIGRVHSGSRGRWKNWKRGHRGRWHHEMHGRRGGRYRGGHHRGGHHQGGPRGGAG